VADGQQRVLQHVAQSLLDDLAAKPRRPETGLNLGGLKVGRLHAVEGGDVHAEALGVDGGRGAGLGQLLAHVARQVLPRRDQAPGARLVVDQRAERGARLLLARAQQPGDLPQVDLALVDEHQVEGFLRGLGPQFHPVRHRGALVEQVLLGRGLLDRVERFQRLDGRAARVGAELLGDQPLAGLPELDQVQALGEDLLQPGGVLACGYSVLDRGQHGAAHLRHLDQLGGGGDRDAFLVLAAAGAHLLAVHDRRDDADQRVAPEVVLQQRDLRVALVGLGEIQPV